MAHPKHRISKARKGGRRSHHKIAPQVSWLCMATGEWHLPHRAHWVGDKLYYRGKVLLEKAKSQQAVVQA